MSDTLYESWTLFDEGYYDSADADPLFQIFTPETDHWITSIELLLQTYSGYTGTLTVEIQTVSAGLPSGAVIGSGTYNILLIAEETDVGAWYEIFLSCGVVAGTDYAIVIRSDNDVVGWFYQNDEGPYYNDKPEYSGYGDNADGVITYESWYPGWEQSYCFKEYGVVTGYLSGSNFVDLKTELNEKDVWNDVRVLLPSYDYTLELVGGTWYKYPITLEARAVSGESINKYGRRTKTLNKHIPYKPYAETYCAGEVDQRKEPLTNIELKMIGVDATNIVTILSTAVNDEISCVLATAGLNSTGIVDSLTLDIDLDQIPRLTMRITDYTTYQSTDLFWIDTDSIDGDHVLGW